jgi:dienelactone hydrolase
MQLSSASRWGSLAATILFACCSSGCGPRTGDGAVAPADNPGAPSSSPAPSGGSTPVDPGGSLAPAPSPLTGSRCTIAAATGDIDCVYQGDTVDGRAVLWQTPLGTPPAAGWPVVFVFQGSLFAPVKMWSATKSDLFGIFGTYTQTLMIKRLLDGGYAVVTPQADLGATAWDTNLPPWADLWTLAPDNAFLDDLFAAVDAGHLGAVDHARWYATGVSSGGYMTSRMAVSYPGRFRALAIAAGSYATCGGPLCALPLTLPTAHPPTLFLHGGSDPVVPIATMYAYRDALILLGRETKTVVDATFLHGWIPATPAEVGAWFDTH